MTSFVNKIMTFIVILDLKLSVSYRLFTMSMLAERKRKVKWSDDPNGLRWAKDTNTFGRKMLEKMGWQGAGLGKLQDGNQDFIKMAFKNDNTGLGCVEQSDRDSLLTMTGGLDDILASLKGSGPETSTDNSTEKPKFSLAEASKLRGTRFHYKRMVEAKDVSHRMDQVIPKEKSVKQEISSVPCSKTYFKLKSKKLEGSGEKVEDEPAVSTEVKLEQVDFVEEVDSVPQKKKSKKKNREEVESEIADDSSSKKKKKEKADTEMLLVKEEPVDDFSANAPKSKKSKKRKGNDEESATEEIEESKTKKVKQSKSKVDDGYFSSDVADESSEKKKKKKKKKPVHDSDGE